MNYKQKNFQEYAKRGALKVSGADVNKKGNFILFFNSKMKSPNKFDIFLGYVTMCIPAAIMARVVRKMTNRKGTLLENQLMEYYFDMSVKLLSRKNDEK